MKRIATHKKPDADALVATWLAERYLFSGDEVAIIFVARNTSFLEVADCVVDVTNTFNVQRLIFDHKPPAFESRNHTCAAKLVWEYLVLLGHAVQHLAPLVNVVHEGDSNPPRKASAELTHSHSSGIHAVVTSTRARNITDTELYEVVRTWLDAYDVRTRMVMEKDSLPDVGEVILLPCVFCVTMRQPDCCAH